MTKDNTMFQNLMTKFYVVKLITLFSNCPQSKAVVYYVIYIYLIFFMILFMENQSSKQFSFFYYCF